MKKLKNNKNKQTKGLIHRVCFLICAKISTQTKVRFVDRAKAANFTLTIVCTLENHCKSAGARTLLAVSILPWPHFSLYKETCLPRGGSQRKL